MRTFYPSNDKASKKLDPIEIMMAPMSVAGAMSFMGEIDVERFLDALQLAANTFDCLFFIFHERGGEVYAEYEKSPSEGGPGSYFECEIDMRPDEVFDDRDTATPFLPNKVHEKMLRMDLAMGSLEGMPFSAFKLTILRGSFVIGYRLNHVYFDQSSIVYFFRYLAEAYSNGTTTLESPLFLARSSVVDSEVVFSDREEFLAATPTGYTIDPPGLLDVAPPKRAVLCVKPKATEPLVKSSSEYFSKNDILNAVLLKAMSKNPDNHPGTVLRVIFTRNMRKSCGLGEHVVGDFSRFEAIDVKQEVVAHASLLELAKISRTAVSTVSKEKYKEECSWFMQKSRYCPGPVPLADYLLNPNVCVVTNWSSFPYEKINFAGATPMSLLVNPIPILPVAGAGIAIISFKGTEPRRLTQELFSGTEHVLHAIRALATESGLFDTNTDNTAAMPPETVVPRAGAGAATPPVGASDLVGGPLPTSPATEPAPESAPIAPEETGLHRST